MKTEEVFCTDFCEIVNDGFGCPYLRKDFDSDLCNECLKDLIANIKLAFPNIAAARKKLKEYERNY